MNHQPRIFISSVQKELAAERRTLADFIKGDPLIRRYFDVFLFEDLPATDRRADDVYLDDKKETKGTPNPSRTQGT